MTYEELKLRFPRASEFVLRANADPSPDQAPELEQCSKHELAGTPSPKKKDPNRYVVRITTYLTILYDKDNICEKFHVDALRYCGLIPGDAPGQCEIEVEQIKVSKPEEERTVVEIIPPATIDPNEKAAIEDYVNRLKRWAVANQTPGSVFKEEEPSFSHIKCQWLVNQLRRQILNKKD